MTTEQVYELRDLVGFKTPIRPIERGKPWTVFNDRGRIEYMMHPDDAFEALTFGYPLGSERLLAKDVGIYPLINAIQILVIRGVLWEPGGRKWAMLCRLSEMGGSLLEEAAAAC